MSIIDSLTSTATTLAALLLPLSAALLWLADKRYVTHKAMAQAINEMRLAQINDLINELDTKKQYKEATTSDLVRLDYYMRQREEMLKKLN